MAEYICIEELTLHVFDENEWLDETQTLEIEEGSVWTEEDEEIGEVRLERVFGNVHQWMEISQQTLSKHFKRV